MMTRAVTEKLEGALSNFPVVGLGPGTGAMGLRDALRWVVERIGHAQTR